MLEMTLEISKNDKYDLYNIQNKFLEIIDVKEELRNGLGDHKKGI